MRAGRWLLDPLRILPALFIGQALFWWLAMPDQPTVPFALPKYHSVEAILRYGILLTALLLAVWLGSWVVGTLGSKKESPVSGLTTARINAAIRVGRLATVLSVIGELLFAREIIANPQIVLL